MFVRKEALTTHADLLLRDETTILGVRSTPTLTNHCMALTNLRITHITSMRSGCKTNGKKAKTQLLRLLLSS